MPRENKRVTFGAIPPVNCCTLILSMPPSHDWINDFEKSLAPRMFFLPVWTEDEMGSIASCVTSVIEWRD